MTPTVIAWNRFGLGARPHDDAPADPQSWLLDQMALYDPLPGPIAAQPSSTDAIQADLAVRAIRSQARSGSISSSDAREQVRMIGRATRKTYGANVVARAEAALQTSAPFLERMVHFWANHFAVSVGKNQVRGLAGAHEFEAIRPHVAGSFQGMLRAAALHPAMLVYLDQFQSTGPNSQAAQRAASRRRRTRGLNENLAREILELHTLGVDGGYSQGDVTEFAKALTGWTITGLPRARRSQPFAQGTAWANLFHEPGTRTLLGKPYRQEGQQQSLAFLDHLATHPATARHIATKLARHFAGDVPPPAMVDRLARVFMETDGDMPALYRTLIESPEAWVRQPVKFRTPWDWTIASLRAVDGSGRQLHRLARVQNELGQPVWGPSSPQGFPDLQGDWAAPDALLRRVELAAQLAAYAEVTDVDELAAQLFPNALSEGTSAGIARAASPQQGLALLLAAPEMMRR